MSREHRQEAGPPVSNPPGLSQVAYRAGDFATFRHALLSPLAGEQQLAGWSPRPGDLGLQALEWWAYLADILTFYNERIANGSYLGTAVAQPGPQHAAALAALLGYRAMPAITATGLIAAIRGAGSPDGPLTIPAGPQMQIMNTPTATVPAQFFEVTDARTFTGPSDAVIALPPDPALFRPVAGQPAAGGQITVAGQATGGAQATVAGQAAAGAAAPRTVLLAGPVTISPGDQFIVVNRGWDGTTADWSAVSVTSAAAEKDPAGRANTRLTLSSADWHGLGGDPPQGAASGGPLAADYQLQRAPSTAALWTMSPGVGGLQAAGAPSSLPAGASPQTLTVPLATLVRALSPGDNVLFTGSTGGAAPRAVQLLAQVTGYTEEVTRVPAAAAGTVSPAGTAPPAGTARGAAPPDVYLSHTNLTVRTAGADGDVAALRAALGTSAPGASALGGIVLRYGFRDAGQLIPTPAQILDRLPVTVGVPAGLRLPGGPVALQDANGTGLLVTASPAVTPGAGAVTLAPWDGGPGVLDQALQAPVSLLADLVPVSRGTTVSSEVLGGGDPSAAGQAFVLRYSPLVYLPPAEPGGDPVSSLSVQVNGAPWREVQAFAGQPGGAQVYVTSQLPDGSVQVCFGDGVNGARLPLGTGNVTATYRYGAPVPPPPAGTLSTVLTPQPNLGAVRNPVGIAGGTVPESAGTTAQAAPATVVLLPGMNSVTPPLISLTDSERIAATVSGVTRARAYWTWDKDLGCPAVTVYVGSDSDSDTAAAVTAVSGLFPRATGRVPLSAAAARGVGLAVSGRLLCSPGAAVQDTVRAATAALTGPAGLFSPHRMRIGQRLYRSEVEAALMVAGVSAVLGLRVHRSGPGPSPEDQPDEAVLDPGQDGYFSLPGNDLSLSAVIP